VTQHQITKEKHQKNFRYTLARYNIKAKTEVRTQIWKACWQAISRQNRSGQKRKQNLQRAR
jgi:hypothetical protein